MKIWHRSIVWVGEICIFSIITVLFLAMTREAYATVMSFLLLIIKAMLVLKMFSNQQGLRYEQRRSTKDDKFHTRIAK